MITLVKDFSDYNFSSALDKLEIATNEEMIQFIISNGEGEILNEKYVPDADGKIVIFDVRDLLEPYLTAQLIDTFNYRIIGNSTISKDFVVQYCAAESSLDATVFLQNYFLTALMGNKVTSVGRKEFVHLVAIEEVSVSVSCLYLKADNTYTSITVNLNNAITINTVSTVEVSPELFVDETIGTLFQYTVNAGLRSLTFDVDLYNPDVAPSLLFTNSFGCQETIYCTGTHSLSPNFERSQAVINGLFKNYHIEEERMFTANTGVLNIAMAQWADELFRSKEIYLLNGSTPDKEIAITSSQSDRNNDYDNLPSFSFEYRYAQKLQNILMLPTAGRVFDNTFDNTFS